MDAPTVLVDADACPVKDEIFKVAMRKQVPVVIVANSYLRIPEHRLFSRKIVSDGFDAADDYIAENADALCVVITADILLAERCLKAGAIVLSPKGTPFDDNNIGNAVAVRAIMADQRAGLNQTGGPAPFKPADRSRFLNALDNALVAVEKRAG